MTDLKEFFTDDVKRVGIAGHRNPDGDCAGSVLGLYAYLTENVPGVTVVPFLDSPLPQEIAYLLNGEPTRADSGEDEVFDLVFIVDCATPDRLMAGAGALKKAKKTVVFDHHGTNPGFGDENYIDAKASSTCEVLTRFMEPERISGRAALCLYSGILFDTDVFRYDCTGPETLRQAAMLLEKGVPFAEIIRKSFTEQPYNAAKVTAAVMDKAVLIPEEEFLYAVADLDLLHMYGATSTDIGNVVSELNHVRETETTLFMYQYEDGTWKGSLRSKTRVDVSKIAYSFGGGGHVRAAGFSFEKDPLSMMEKVKTKVREQMNGRHPDHQ
ncbi:MAG: bifunctional oligoribonuclease/PAP phosphatase NrnA [Lachnospiraceae bacterium]|nr:bifunctional oligoribonuclease/PAP phosphatase NrnA [Lachnospiraceae bacterium]